jgi:dCTP deaminase
MPADDVTVVGDDERHRRRDQAPVVDCDEMPEPRLTSEHDDRRRVILSKRRRPVHPADGNRHPRPLRSRAVILSDRTVREQLAAGRIVVEPLDESLIQPSSIDVRMSNLFRVFRNHTAGIIDVKRDMTSLTELIEMPEDGSEPFMLHPGEFALGSTMERIALPDDLVARIEGKSSLGRLGLLIHSTAGFIDAGFDGHVTLELANVASLPITLYPGMKIGQVSFMRMTTPADKPYGKGATGSKYQGQRGPTPSRYFENF